MICWSAKRLFHEFGDMDNDDFNKESCVLRTHLVRKIQYQVGCAESEALPEPSDGD